MAAYRSSITSSCHQSISSPCMDGHLTEDSALQPELLTVQKVQFDWADLAAVLKVSSRWHFWSKNERKKSSSVSLSDSVLS